VSGVGGLYIALSPGAQWNAATRLAIAQGSCTAWLGGRLPCVNARRIRAEAGAWFGMVRAPSSRARCCGRSHDPRDYAGGDHDHIAEWTTSPCAGPQRRGAAAAVRGDPPLDVAGDGVERSTPAIELTLERGGIPRRALTGRRRERARRGVKAPGRDERLCPALRSSIGGYIDSERKGPAGEPRTGP